MFFNITVRRVSWPAFTFSISIRYFFALRSAASLSAAVGFYRSAPQLASTFVFGIIVGVEFFGWPFSFKHGRAEEREGSRNPDLLVSHHF